MDSNHLGGLQPTNSPKSVCLELAARLLVDERVASLTSVSKPCMQVSLHTAPQLLFPCHGYVAFAP